MYSVSRQLLSRFSHPRITDCKPKVNLILLLAGIGLLTLQGFIPFTPSGTFIVDTLVDETGSGCVAGHCSLRKAVAAANAGDTITFSVTGTITLTHGEIAINKNLTISGPGPGSLTISGNNSSRVFNNQYSATTISGLTIIKGYTLAGGGGIINSGNPLTLTNCAFIANVAYFGPGGLQNDGTAVIHNCTFSNNISYGLGGGAIMSENESLTVDGSTFTGNQAVDGNGGAIFNFTTNSTALVTNSTFTGNSARHGGAINNSGYLTVNRSTLANNTASTGNGGGIYNEERLELTTCTLANNNAQNGGGIYNRDVLLLKTSSLSDNSASSSGGGIYNLSSGEVAWNNIFANSSGGNCNAANYFGQDSRNNLATDATCGNSFTQVSPEALKLYWTGRVFQLLAGSAAIDAGSNDYCPSPDQIGTHRPLDGDGNGGPLCDVGAIEARWLPNKLYLPVVRK